MAILDLEKGEEEALLIMENHVYLVRSHISCIESRLGLESPKRGLSYDE